MSRTGRPSAREVLTFEGMVAEQEKAKHTRVYKAENLQVSSQEIQKSVRTALDEMHKLSTGKRIRLEDTDTVKELTEQYLTSCIQTSTMPKMSGLARALGYSKDGLYWFMRNKKEHPTTDWLKNFHDVCSDVLAQNSLMGTVHPIVAIFLQKALYGLRDNITIETVPPEDGRMESMDHDELIRKYGHLIESEE